MDYFVVALIAVGLAMDAFAVSLSKAIACHDSRPTDALKMGAYCGGFQAAMLFLGWLIGFALSSIVESYAHWIAFVILMVIGIRMLFDKPKESAPKDQNHFALKSILLLAFATSIDAFATGVGLIAFNTHIAFACLIIGLIAFVFSFLGVLLGKKLAPIFKGSASIIGGIVLIIIALQMVIRL